MSRFSMMLSFNSFGRDARDAMTAGAVESAQFVVEPLATYTVGEL
jgi:hypothetical protein